MKELIHKLVKIVFNSSTGRYGLIGTTCEVTGVEDGFIITVDKEQKVSYYAIESIKAITIEGEDLPEKEYDYVNN